MIPGNYWPCILAGLFLGIYSYLRMMASKSYIDPKTGKDSRYQLIKVMYDDGHIHTLQDIFKFIPKTNVAKDMKMAVDQFNKLLGHPDQWQLKKLIEMGGLCDLSPLEIMNLVVNSYEDKKKERKG